MADGTYCNYSGEMDTNVLSQISGYGSRTGTETLEGDASSKGAGFYMEQFPAGMQTATMSELGLLASNLAGNHGHQDVIQAGLVGQLSGAAQQGMYESVMNYAMKPEKGMPPTPPGSPGDSKGVQQGAEHGFQGNMHPASMVAMASAINHNVLAKPVPMRRLSEKRIAQARASLTSASNNTFPPEPNIEHTLSADSGGGQTLARAIAAVQQTQKRPRSEKKPIPDEQKDIKYFERRKRNNNAAKKSRDARKAREDEIAIRASFLEKENAILRAQVATLREEANSLRQLLLQKRSRH